MRILQTTAAFLVLYLIVNLAVRGWLGPVLEATALFLVLAISVNLAVYGWLGLIGAWSAMEDHAHGKLVHALIAGTFTVMAASTWYALSFVVRPFG